MKRFLRPSTQDYPHGFGQVLDEPEVFFSETYAIRSDYRCRFDAITNHGVVLYERIDDADGYPTDCRLWINDEAKGVFFHDGAIGHGPVHGISLFALEPSDTPTLCADLHAVATATYTVLQDPKNRHLIKAKGGVLGRSHSQLISSTFQDLCTRLRKGNKDDQQKALHETRTFLMSLSNTPPYSLELQGIYQLARDIQLQVGDALIPIDWNEFWLAHLSDNVVHARDIRSQNKRDHNQTFGYCSQIN